MRPSASESTTISKPNVTDKTPTTAAGRFLPFALVIFLPFERPLTEKADVQILLLKKLPGNDRFAPGSSR
jgi:hypothetical protein